MAHKIVKYLEIKQKDTILDFGCALGYLVKALRLLGYEAKGYDTSRYALDNCDREIENHVFGNLRTAEWCISKDVFEHLYEKEIDDTLKNFKKHFKKVFLIIPLGDGEKFVVPEYEHDTTHITKQTKEWWENKFTLHGWDIKKFDYLIKGVKENWRHHEKGNGFWVITNE